MTGVEAHFASVWEAIADAAPDAIALREPDRVRTWAEYENRSARLASEYLRVGLSTGDRVGLLLDNGIEHCEVNFATLKARLQPVNLNQRYTLDELAYVLNDAGATSIAVRSQSADLLPRLYALVPTLRHSVVVGGEAADIPASAVSLDAAVAASEPAARVRRSADDDYVFYTGGTTGYPKGVVYRIGDVVAFFYKILTAIYALPEGAVTVASAARLAATGRLVSFPMSPLTHAAGLWAGVMGPQLFGAQVALLPGPRFDPHTAAEWLADARASACVVVGDAYLQPILDHLGRGRTAPPSLEVIISSGARLSANTKTRLVATLPRARTYDVFASTEGGFGYSVSRAGEPLPATGVFTPSPDTALFTEGGERIPQGSARAGLLATSGFLVPQHFRNDPERSGRTIRTIEGLRWSFSGDWGHYLPDGNMQFVGRGSGCINTAGEKVFPDEVEKHIMRLAGVRDCMVLGVPDDRFGERVAALVVLEPGVIRGADELRNQLRGQLSGYKLPRQVRFVDQIPRTPVGKPDYVAAARVVSEHDDDADASERSDRSAGTAARGS